MKLSSLTREQKLYLYDLIQERKRRQREAKAVYSPNPGQAPVHASTKRIRAVFSGNGGGKTALAANEALWGMKGYNPIKKEFTKVPARGIVVLDHPEKTTDLWVPELLKWANIKPEHLHKRGKPNITAISDDNGSELIFMSHQQDPLTFESIEADFIIFDEPPPRHIYIALMRGLRKKGRKPWVLIVATPISAAWMRTEIYEPWQKGERPNIECFTYGTETNSANLADGYIEEFSSALTEKEKRIRLHGEFFDLEGLALKHLFRRETHVLETNGFEWDSDNPCVIALDPHPAKAHHAVLLGADKYDSLYVLDEFKFRASTRPFAEALIKRGWFENYRIVDIVYDSLGNSENLMGEGFKSFGAIFNEVLEEHELGRARATTFQDKDDEDFIERIRDSLLIPPEPDNFGNQLPKLRFLSRCTGCIHDVENVQWMTYAKQRNIDENKPKLDIRHKDFLACMKYALASNLYHSKPKNKLYRRARPVSTYGQGVKQTPAYFRRKLNSPAAEKPERKSRPRLNMLRRRR